MSLSTRQLRYLGANLASVTDTQIHVYTKKIKINKTKIFDVSPVSPATRVVSCNHTVSTYMGNVAYLNQDTPFNQQLTKYSADDVEWFFEQAAFDFGNNLNLEVVNTRYVDPIDKSVSTVTTQKSNFWQPFHLVHTNPTSFASLNDDRSAFYVPGSVGYASVGTEAVQIKKFLNTGWITNQVGAQQNRLQRANSFQQVARVASLTATVLNGEIPDKLSEEREDLFIQSFFKSRYAPQTANDLSNSIDYGADLLLTDTDDLTLLTAQVAYKNYEHFFLTELFINERKRGTYFDVGTSAVGKAFSQYQTTLAPVNRLMSERSVCDKTGLSDTVLRAKNNDVLLTVADIPSGVCAKLQPLDAGSVRNKAFSVGYIYGPQYDAFADQQGIDYPEKGDELDLLESASIEKVNTSPYSGDGSLPVFIFFTLLVCLAVS